MKLTNEEIARVFDLYNENEKVVYTGTASEDLRYNGKTVRNSRILRENFAKDRDWKLKIIPLEKITYLHAVRVIKIQSDVYLHAETEITKRGILFTFQYASSARRRRESIYWDDLNPMQFQYLISNGYAVPLWFGIEHWANGKTAIELKIAFDATLTKAA